MNRIKELRLEKGWTQGELAAMLAQKNQQAISKIERNEIDLNTDDIRRLCEIFGVTADYLLAISAVRSHGISDGEWQLVAAYRLADEDDRVIVDRALRKYKSEKKETTAG